MAKRLFDLLLGALLFSLTSPFFIVCVLAVKLSSKGPIFYSHPRIGEKGKPFGCLKFRTMFLDADIRLDSLLQENPHLKAEWEKFYKLKQDPRITPIGRFLRKYSLDELPQFLNVFKGEMSLVGPRPLTQAEVHDYLKDKATKILSIKPGLTTLWIVRGRNRFSLSQRIRWEEFYVDHRTLGLDLRLIFWTAYRIFVPKGAY